MQTMKVPIACQREGPQGSESMKALEQNVSARLLLFPLPYPTRLSYQFVYVCMGR